MPVLTLPGRVQRSDASTAYRGVLPVDPPRSHSSGPAPYRVLAVGGRLLAGHGVLTHDLGVTGALARGLTRLVGHGFDVESLIVDRSTLDGVSRALKRRDLSKVDALVLMLDPGGESWNALETVGRIHRVVDDLWRRLTPAASITLVVPPATMAQRSDDELAEFAAAVRDGAAALTRVVRLADRLEVSGPAERYTTWGETIAATVAEGLTEPLVWCDPVDQLDERKRQAAVRRLGVLDAEWEGMFRRIVTFAGRAYGARYASLSIVDGDRTRYFTRRGFDSEWVAREQTICDLALRTYGGVIVGDAQADGRFADFPLVRSGHVRFYAGYRVESPDGQPVGVVCVFDPEPRPVLSQDLGLLRDFATAAQRRIWELTQE